MKKNMIVFAVVICLVIIIGGIVKLSAPKNDPAVVEFSLYTSFQEDTTTNDSNTIYYWQTDEHKKDYEKLFNDLQDNGYTREELELIFSDSRVEINKYMLPKSIQKKKDKKAKEIKKAEKPKKPPPVSEFLIEDMVDFSIKHAWLLRHINKKHGIDWEMIVAILEKETNLGKGLGTFRAFNAYNTLIRVYKLYPTWKEQRKKKKQGFDRLFAFLVLCKQKNWEPLEIYGSYAGALGIPQFMPPSYLAYAVDGDLDGTIDLFTNWSDVCHSVANYLLKHGWRKGIWDEKNKKVLLSYNYSGDYRDDVWAYAQELRKAWKQKYPSQ